MSKGFKKDDPKYEVLSKLIDFRKVIVGDKIKSLYNFVSESQGDQEDEADNFEKLTQTSLDQFNYQFTNLKLAEMMYHDQES